MGRRSKNKQGKREPNGGSGTLSRQEVPPNPVPATKEPEESDISHYMSLVSPNIAAATDPADVTLGSCSDTNTIQDKSLLPSEIVKNTRREANVGSDTVENSNKSKSKLDKTKKNDLTVSTKTVVDAKPNITKEKTVLFFDLIEKVAKLLKSGDGEELLTVLQKLLPVMQDTDAKKVKATYRILDVFLSSVRDCNLDYVTYMEEHIKSVIIPGELSQLFVQKDMIKQGYILLGEGAFGKVTIGKLVKSRRSAVTVAIKEANETRFNSMLIEEAKIMSQLDHDVILKVLAFTNVEGTIKLVIEFMELGDICDAIIQERVFLTHADVLKIIHDVCWGMEYLTDKGYIHRDLKCQNVFLNRKKKCKIGDFGICKYVGDSGGTYKENDMRVNGTHVAPESNETNKFTRKSDVWAMGILIWDLYSINSIWLNTQDTIKLELTMVQMRTIFILTGHLPQPRNCPIELHQYVVKEILNRNPSRRPEFGNIKKKILQIMRK